MPAHLTTKGWALLFASTVSLLGSAALDDLVLLAAGLAGLTTLISSYSKARAATGQLARARVARLSSLLRAPEGRSVEISFEVELPEGHTLDRIGIADRTPPRVKPATAPIAYASLEGGASRAVIGYRARVYIGRSRFDESELIYPAPLGLAVATRLVDTPGFVEAYPAPSLALEVLARHSRLHGVSRPINRRWPLGSEFLELREYVEGDDPRLIHWPSTARLGELVVRETALETRIDAAILVDHSVEMWAGPPGGAPIDGAARLAAVLAELSEATGGSAGVILFDGWECNPSWARRIAAKKVYRLLSTLEPGHGRSTDALMRCVRLASALSEGRVLAVLTGPGSGVEKAVRSFRSSLAAPHPVAVMAFLTPSPVKPEYSLISRHTFKAVEGSMDAVAGGWLEALQHLVRKLEVAGYW